MTETQQAQVKATGEQAKVWSLLFVEKTISNKCHRRKEKWRQHLGTPVEYECEGMDMDCTEENCPFSEMNRESLADILPIAN